MRELSIFVDESGDFGFNGSPSSNYLLTLLFHDQSRTLEKNSLQKLNEELQIYFPGGAKTYVHAEPIIRREKEFENMDLNERRHIINTLFHFAIKSDICYKTIIVDKTNYTNNFMWLNTRLTKDLNSFIDSNYENLLSYDCIKIYYDRGQKEITNILNTIFLTRFNNVVFKENNLHEYRLFQVADLICTFELLNHKLETSKFSKSEEVFFENARKFRKNYYKQISRKKM